MWLRGTSNGLIHPPLSGVNDFRDSAGGAEKAGGGGSIPSLATNNLQIAKHSKSSGGEVFKLIGLAPLTAQAHREQFLDLGGPDRAVVMTGPARSLEFHHPDRVGLTAGPVQCMESRLAAREAVLRRCCSVVRTAGPLRASPQTVLSLIDSPGSS